MKKLKALLLVVVLASLSISLYGCKKQSTVTKVKLNEVVHSIFYAPQYVSLEKGFFVEEGLEIELSVGQGADARVTQGKYFYMLLLAARS